MEFPDLSILQWLDAGATPMLVLLSVLLFRVERRLYRVEMQLEHWENDSD